MKVEWPTPCNKKECDANLEELLNMIAVRTRILKDILEKRGVAEFEEYEHHKE